MSLLSRVITALQTYAGVTTIANSTEAGYWLRIAVAAETLAGASSAANNTIEGYMLRAAVALELVAAGGALPALGTLSLSSTTFTRGSATSGSIIGATGLSVITASGLPSGLTINSAARTWAWDGTGSGAVNSSLTLTETLAGYSNTPRSTVIAYSITVVAGALATPTLAIASTLGAAPLVLSVSDTDDAMGLFGQLQIDQTSNAFSNITQDILFFIDASNIANLDEAIGLATPPGLYFARFRVVRDNDSGATTVTSNEWNGQAFNAVTLTADVSLWSNIKTDTIVSSVAVFAHSVSTDFKSGLAFSNTDHTMLGQAFGAFQGSRANLAGASKAQFEIHFDTLQTGSAVYFGIEDGSTDFSAFNALPGYTNANGVTIALTQGNTTVSVFRNSAGTQTDFTTTAPATGATFTCEYDRTLAGGSQILSVYRNGTLVGTVSGLTITTFTKFWVGVRNDDQVTINPGNAAFVHALNTGYVMYG